ncbi:MAG: formylglycine-generating enzyme family protein [Chitinophagales bacterium]|nr:formylglycine-generating enzyme family protein [Chitinophagales bacterium]
MRVIYAMLFTALLCHQLFGQAAPPKPKTTIPAKASLAEVTAGIEANMIFVQGGTFTMGCTKEQDTCYASEKPAHKVTLSNFYINKYPVTQREWETVMGTRPWFSKNCPECPVEHVSWYDAQSFINTLNQATGKYYRLPTEAEWEYAARGGSKSQGYQYAGGNNPDEIGWYEVNSNKQSHPVGQKKPNELGLYDMSGNVWQWCNDWYDENYYQNSPAKDPQGPGRDSYRTCRGGSWWSEVGDLRLSNRDRYPPDARDDDVGFRIVKD